MHQISIGTRGTTLGENASATYVVTNAHETAVQFDFDVIWYTDMTVPGDDFMEGVTRTHLVLEAGESARLTVEYPGNASIDRIDYAINTLRYAGSD